MHDQIDGNRLGFGILEGVIGSLKRLDLWYKDVGGANQCGKVLIDCLLSILIMPFQFLPVDMFLLFDLLAFMCYC